MTGLLGIDAELAQFRELAESLMTATIVVRRKTGATTTNPATDSDVPVWADVFTSACKVQDTEPLPVESEVGARTVVTVRQRVDLPVGSPMVKPGDVGEITTAADPMDAHLVGMKFEFISASAASFKTAHRWPVRRFLS